MENINKAVIAERVLYESYRGNLSLNNICGEVWRPVCGMDGIVLISSFFRVKVISRIVTEKGGKMRPLPGLILKQKINKDGYWQIRVTIGGKRIGKRPHRMWAQSFLPNPEKYKVINHKNLIKTDNYPSNIEWCTAEYNTKHANKNGAIPVGEDVVHSKLRKEQVVEIFNSKESSRMASKRYKITHRMVLKIRNGISWKSITETIG